MKRLGLALTIFIITIVVCICALGYIKSKKDEYSNILHLAYTQAKNGDIESAKRNVEKFRKLWGENEKYLMLLIHHEDLGEITFSARMITEYIDTEELPEFFAELEKEMALLDHLWEAEVPLPKNFL